MSLLSFVGDFFGGLWDFAKNVWDGIKTTFNNFLEDPLPTIAAVVLQETAGVPMYVTNTAIAAARGAPMEQMVLDLAKGYVAQQAGKYVGEQVSPNVGIDATGGLETAVAPEIFKTVITQASAQGFKAALDGKNFDEILSSSVSGAITGYVNANIQSLGLASKFQKDLYSKAISAATNAVLGGRSVAEAVGDAISKTTLESSVTTLTNDLRKNVDERNDLYEQYTTLQNQSKEQYADINRLNNAVFSIKDANKNMESARTGILTTLNQKIPLFNELIQLSSDVNSPDRFYEILSSEGFALNSDPNTGEIYASRRNPFTEKQEIIKYRGESHIGFMYDLQNELQQKLNTLQLINDAQVAENERTIRVNEELSEKLPAYNELTEQLDNLYKKINEYDQVIPQQANQLQLAAKEYSNFVENEINKISTQVKLETEKFAEQELENAWQAKLSAEKAQVEAVKTLDESYADVSKVRETLSNLGLDSFANSNLIYQFVGKPEVGLENTILESLDDYILDYSELKKIAEEEGYEGNLARYQGQFLDSTVKDDWEDYVRKEFDKQNLTRDEAVLKFHNVGIFDQKYIDDNIDKVMSGASKVGYEFGADEVVKELRADIDAQQEKIRQEQEQEKLRLEALEKQNPASIDDVRIAQSQNPYWLFNSRFYNENNFVGIPKDKLVQSFYDNYKNNTSTYYDVVDALKRLGFSEQQAENRVPFFERFVGQNLYYMGPEKLQKQIDLYADRINLTADEVKKIAQDVGYDIPESEVEKYVKKNDTYGAYYSDFSKDLQEQFDKKVVTPDEVIEYFEKQGIKDPKYIQENLPKYVGNRDESSLPQELQKDYSDYKTQQNEQKLIAERQQAEEARLLEEKIDADRQTFFAEQKAAADAERLRLIEEEKAANQVITPPVTSPIAEDKPISGEDDRVTQETVEPAQPNDRVDIPSVVPTETAPARTLQELQKYVEETLQPGPVKLYAQGQLEGLQNIVEKLRNANFPDEFIVDYLKSEQEKGSDNLYNLMMAHAPQQPSGQQPGGDRQAEVEQKPPVAGVAIGESATPPDNAGNVVVGGGSGQTPGLAIPALIAVDSGKKTYDLGNGFTLFAFSDGKQQMMNNETGTIVELRPEETLQNVEKLQAADLKAEQDKVSEEERQLVLNEEQRLAREQLEAEQKRVAEEERQRVLADQQRIAEEQRLAEERRIAEEESQRVLAEQQRQQELLRQQQEAEQARVAEQERLAAEEKLRQEALAKQQREAEEARIAEQQRAEEERRRLLEEAEKQPEPEVKPPVDQPLVDETSVKPTLTQKDLDDAIAKIEFPEGLKAEDVKKIVQEAIVNNPQITPTDVQQIVQSAIQNLPVAPTVTDIRQEINAATKDFATKADIESAVSKIEFPQGINAEDVTSAVKSYMDANPGLKAQDVVDIVKGELQNLPQYATPNEIYDAVNKSAISLRGEITGAREDVRALETRINDLVAQAQAQGQSSDAALNSAINKVASDLGTSQASVLQELGKTKDQLQQEFSRQFSVIGSDVQNVRNQLTDEINAARQAGLSGDAALQAAINNLSIDLGTSKEALLSQLGTTEAQLRQDVAQQISGVTSRVTDVESRLSAAIADAKAAGITGDAALQQAINNVASDLGTTKDIVLEQVGKTEQQLRSDFATQLGGVQAQIGTVQADLTKAIADAKAQGQSDVEAVRSAVNQVSTDLGITKDDLLNRLQETESSLQQKLESGQLRTQEQIQELSTTQQQQYQQLTQSQKQLYDQMVAQGASQTSALNTAMAGVQQQITTGLAGVSAEFQAQLAASDQATKNAFANMSAAQQAEAAARVAQGESLQKSISDVQAGLGQQLTAGLAGVSAEFQAKLAQSDAATQAAFQQMNANQQAETQARVQQGQSLQTAISDVQATLGQQITTGLTDVESRLKAAMAANEAAGLSRDQAISKAVDDVAASVGTTKDALLAQLGTTEQGLRAEFTTGLAGVEAGLTGQIGALSQQTQAQYAALSDAQKREVEARTQMGESLSDAIAGVSTTLTGRISELSTATQQQFANLTEAQKQEVAARFQQGQDLQDAISSVESKLGTKIETGLGGLESKLNDQGRAILAQLEQQGIGYQTALQTALAQQEAATQEAISGVSKEISDVQTQFNNRVDQLIAQGQTQEQATQQAFSELRGSVSQLSAAQQQAAQQAQEAQQQAAQQQASSANISLLGTLGLGLGGLGALGALPGAAGAAPSQAMKSERFMVGAAPQTQFEGPLEQFLKMSTTGYSQQPYGQQPAEEPAMNYYSYGQPSSIDNLLGMSSNDDELQVKSGGLIAPLMAAGGYAPGGLNVINHSGKARLDFRKGAHVAGPGDGQSDDIPAMLADGEFVFPADVVAALGNGSTKAGSDKLYEMMHSIRARARSAKPKDLPPPALKSPLDYLGRR